MNAIWTIARKDLRLLLRDPKAAIILLIMPLAFILVLGISLGEDRLRVSVVDLDQGYQPAQVRAAAAWLAAAPGLPSIGQLFAPAALAEANRTPDFPHQTWSKRVLDDLAQNAGIDVEIIPTREEAEGLIRDSRRAAVLVFGPRFSERVARCSFLEEGINPFFRDGVDIRTLDAAVLRDETQLMSASIIEQVAQGALLRVVLPWMIGQAFEQIGEPSFITRLSKEQNLKVDLPFAAFIDQLSQDKDLKLEVKVLFTKVDVRTIFAGLSPEQKKELAAGMSRSFTMRKVLQLFDDDQKEALATALQDTLQSLFSKYDLTAKNWTDLTRSEPYADDDSDASRYQAVLGSGVLRRGAIRYQKLVPSYTVMFAFFLVLTAGWLFVSERRQGTFKRLCIAPLTKSQIVLGKLLPCYIVSVAQGLFLLGAGKLVFDMSWGPQPAWLLLVVVTTSLAAMGMALLVAALARTETQVAIYGTLLVLLLAGVSGTLLGDRSTMPKTMEQISRITPHAWALDAYLQLLTNPEPNYAIVLHACAVLTLFGVGFVAMAWWGLKLEG